MNKEKALTVLESHKAHWKRLLEEEICDKTEGKETIESFDMAISALSAEGEYIKKEDALNAIRKSDHYGRTQKIYVCHREVVDSIDELPTYSFPDREKGEWEHDEYDNSVTCKKCGCFLYPNDIFNGEPHFCPNCGADMR